MRDGKPLLIEVSKTIVATVVATAGACWTARGILADYDHRLTVVETKQKDQEALLKPTLDRIEADLQQLVAMQSGGKTK